MLCLRSGDVTRKITIKMLPLLFFLLLPMTHKAFDLIVSLALPLSPSLCVCVSISLVLPYIHGCVCTYGGRGSNMSAYRWKGDPDRRSAQTKISNTEHMASGGKLKQLQYHEAQTYHAPFGESLWPWDGRRLFLGAYLNPSRQSYPRRTDRL